MKKFAIIGTHGTGKTTIAYDVTAKLKKKGIHAEMLTEMARKCPFPINKEVNFKGQLWIITNQISKELEMEKHCDILICDRSIIDNYIYLLYSIKDERADMLKPLILNYLKSYDVLFKTKISQKLLIADGIRDTDPIFQKEIDRLANKFLEENKIKFVELPEESPEEVILNKILESTSTLNKFLK